MISEDKAGVVYDESTGLPKSHDVALDILGTTDQHDPIDPAIEKRLVRKIDLMI